MLFAVAHRRRRCPLTATSMAFSLDKARSCASSAYEPIWWRPVMDQGLLLPVNRNGNRTLPLA